LLPDWLSPAHEKIMKLRESGMPAEDYWETLFDADVILERFQLGSVPGDVVELGCGYGTFTLPLARRISGQVHTFDIDGKMVERTTQRASSAGIRNIQAAKRDILVHGYGLPDGSCAAGLLFNILHGESPVELLRDTTRTLRPGGILAVIHWRTDIATPRGPSAEIRPRPEQIVAWATAVEGIRLTDGPFELPPYHYGLTFARRNLQVSNLT